MVSYILAVIGYGASESDGAYEWSISGARGGRSLAAGRGTLTGHGHAAPLTVERLTYHALLAGLQALLAEDYAGALTNAAAPAFIAHLWLGNHSEESDLQRLRAHAVQLLNGVRNLPSIKPPFPHISRLGRPWGAIQHSFYRQHSRQVTIEHLQIHTGALV